MVKNRTNNNLNKLILNNMNSKLRIPELIRKRLCKSQFILYTCLRE